MTTLKIILDQLKSDKPKERQQGLSSLQDTFSRDKALDSIDNGDGKSWLVIFQALFAAVLSERNVVLKKTSGPAAAAERRLKDAAFVVRWMTERSVTKWGTKVTKPLVKHLLQTMVHGGRLFTPVAFDYVKALRSICSYAPHRDHLMTKVEQWLPILSLSFAVVLDDDLKIGLDDELEITSEAEVNLTLSDDDGTPARKRRKIALGAQGGLSRSSAPRTVSPEQIEFVGIIAIILRSPRARLLAPGHEYLARAVLNRLDRFFKLYPAETSAHLDAISAVQASLDSITLNARDEAINFGVSLWDHLLHLWSTKNRSLKDGVLMALKTLLPYIARAEPAKFSKAEGLGKLLRRLQAESSSRWGFEELDLDLLRLEISSSGNGEPFVAKTFRHGYSFNANQTASWANIELMADVMKELYLLSESTHSSATDDRKNRLENPIKSLTQSIQLPRSARGKVYALQCLLFVIDRHWSVLHSEIQRETIDCLLQVIASDDLGIQSWVFCCLAAIAFADSMQHDRSDTSLEPCWEAMWTHSMRRISAPVVSRAACHCAHVLFACAKIPMTRVLAEIETMAQDINIQGPPAPNDSVCAFLSQCVKIANQDTRLHRMHLDDKLLSWLIENWNVLGSISRSVIGVGQQQLEQHTVQDTLNLLESACGISEPSQLFCPIMLPQHAIVELMQSQLDTAVIREYLLDAHFTNTQPQSQSPPHQPLKLHPAGRTGDLSQPDARVRKASAFLLKTLESIIPGWEEGSDRPTAEGIRRTLDFAVLAICFESSLLMNGIMNNRRTLLAACKVVTLIVPHFVDAGWTTEELFMLISSFAPLSSECLEFDRYGGWEAFISAGKSTGIRRTLTQPHNPSPSLTKRLSRRELQSTIWQSSDVQDALSAVLKSIRQILTTFVSDHGKAVDAHAVSAADDDVDGFGSIRVADAPLANVALEKDEQITLKRLVRLCMECFAIAPVLRSSGGHVIKDKTLSELVCKCRNHEKFHMILEPYLWHVHEGNVRLTHSIMDELLTRVHKLLESYKYAHSDSFHVTVIHLLDATASVWLQESFPIETADKVDHIIQWLTESLKHGTLCWWRTRDVFGRFLSRYLALDPLQHFLSDEDGAESEKLPDRLLLVMAKDEDTRVRFTSALSCARLFSTSYIRTKDPMQFYTDIREQLCVDINKYEHMLTRFVCLGNVLIASSAIRRGPYWHLIEACLYTDRYVKHVEGVLSVAASRMGLSCLSDLFESYASQIAYSIHRSGKDFFELPPHLLGYRNRKECAEATFSAFAPANLLASSEAEDDLMHEHGPFARHCKVLGIKPVDGFLRCFTDIAGNQIVFWIEDNLAQRGDVVSELGSYDVDVSGLSAVLDMKFVSIGTGEFLHRQIAQNVDGIICSILRTNGDLDCHRDGLIVKTLETFKKPERSIRAFRALMQFRGNAEFEMHVPNLPCFSSSVVMTALDWLCDQVESANSAASTYHVMHYYFAAIAHCPVINEQLRLSISLCIWISLAYSHFKSTTLLRVLLNGATMLLEQPDLATIAQGMLDWAFIHLRETQRDTPHVVEILIRVCCISRDFIDSDDDTVKKLGSQLKTWIEDEIVSLAEVEVLRKRVAVALAAWPGELDDRLLEIRGSPDLEDLSTILDDPYLSYHKFKVVRRLVELASSPSYDRNRFPSRVFWRLKDSIPVSGLVPQEVDAFTSLLLANSGHIRSQTVDQTYGRSIATRQLKIGTQKDVSTVKRLIVQALLDLLSDPSARVVQVAYRTLRQLAGNEPLDSMGCGSWPSEYKNDISYLDFWPLKESIDTRRDLSEIAQPQFIGVAACFSDWISCVTTYLASVLSESDNFYAHLPKILNDNPNIATQMFPILVHSLLLSSSGGSARILLSDYLTQLLNHTDVDVQCLHSIINLVLHLRHFDPGVEGDKLAYNRWLDMDFMLLSRSAIKCGAYTTALLFLELAVEYKQDPKGPGKTPEEILFEIYSHIDEPDGFYGIKTHDLQDFLVRRFHHERQWEKAFQFHGAGYEAGRGNYRSSIGIVESLHSFGFNKLALTTLQSLESSAQIGNMEYRLGWRTEAWDLPEPRHRESDATLYVALRAIHRERDPEVIDGILFKALSDELHRLRDLGTENLAEIREVNRNMMCLAQMRRWRSTSVQNTLCSASVTAEDAAWQEFCALQSDFEFSDLESIIATRISLIHSARQKEQRDQIGDMQSDLTRVLLQVEGRCLLQLSEASREANQAQVALNSILCALKLYETPGFEIQQEFANVLWLQHERKFAVDCLREEVRRRIQNAPCQESDPRKVQDALALAKLGEWTSEACLEKPAFIHSNYFLPAINLLVGGRKETQSLGDVRAAVFYKCALFAEQQYHALILSEEIKRLQVYRERKTQEIAERKQEIQRAPKKQQAELHGHQRKAEALYAQDTAQLNEFIAARDNYLRQAVEMLSLCLKASDSFDVDAVIRLCSLWFANFKSDASIVQGIVDKIPSRKFVFLAHQLSARLSVFDISNPNQKVLQSLVLQMCSDHPFHSLYQVYSLQSSRTDNLLRSRRSSSSVIDSSQTDRAEAAFGLFERLLNAQRSSVRANNVRKLCDAYLEWAKFPIKNDAAILDRRSRKDKSSRLYIPKNLSIMAIKDLRVPVTTANTPLDPSTRYEDCVWIHGYADTYETAGGINLPKICYCVGSDGVRYKQLFKGEGNDDLRQDAVMEQVFGLCNQVLSRDQQTRKRELSIRSYKVVPLASQAGLLEFVGKTRPLQLLVAAHEKYNKSDLTARECHRRLAQRREEVQRTLNGPALRTALVDEFVYIRQRFRPVMRHLFTEQRKDPQAWFEMRLKYSRSVAVTSIVGHILGLGDRHLSNILLDTVTGEVVHIDLGIAFEQGKLLPIPERVPFRLTADIVDGLGISGTDGVFRRCAEETLRVLREGSSVIKTVLEVFKYDPLHSWTMSAMKIRKAQAPENTNHNHNESDRLGFGTGIGIDLNSGVEDESADRALSSVAKKLDKSLSVEYTVNELIAEATDDANLALMFVGWSPYC